MLVQYISEILTWVEQGVITPAQGRQAILKTLPLLCVDAVPVSCRGRLIACCDDTLTQLERDVIDVPTANAHMGRIFEAATQGDHDAIVVIAHANHLI